jgi:RsmE family RNA methyltransferase
MNLILFNKEEFYDGIPSSDPRFQHIKNILKIGLNDTFDSGIINGPRGIATITGMDKYRMSIEFTAQSEPLPLYRVTLIVGVPRPPTARRLLKDMTSTGIDRIWFTGTDLGEKSYLTSKIWKDDKYREYVIEGAQQGESTILPEIRKFYSLKSCLNELEDENRCALDNNEFSKSISLFQGDEKRTVIAVGSERGWTENERNLLKEYNFSLLSMGSRVLRTETACSMGVGFILASKGLM